MSIKKNFSYNILLVISNYIFPLLVYPYVSRILGVNNIGICSFIDSIINYFILISMMGFTTIGIREMANFKEDKEKLDKSFSAIISLNILFTIFSVILLVICTYSIEKLYVYKDLLFYGVFKLIFNVLLIEWFFQGIEQFKYITIRSIIVKTIHVISIFLFVNKASDFKIFYLLSVLLVVVNAIINWEYKTKYVSYRFSIQDFKQLIKPTLTFGVYKILTSFYTTFNVAYLGFIANSREVGYYVNATKFHSIVIAIFTSFTSVMLPRMSSLIGNNNLSDFNKYTNKSLELLYTFCFPIIFILILLAPEIIFLFSGKGYDGSIIPLIIISPLILIIGLEQVIIVQMLIPLKKDNAILINAIIGAFVGLVLNFLLIKYFQSIGSAIVWLLSETIVLLSSYYFIRKYIDFKIRFDIMFKNLFFSIPIILLILLIKHLTNNYYYILLYSFILTFFYFIIIQIFFLKNSLVVDFVSYTNKKINGR